MTPGNAVGEEVRAGVAAGPLFLVGVRRSGTTLLDKQLCLHPDVAYISNWMRTAPAVPALALANRLTLRRHPQDNYNGGRVVVSKYLANNHHIPALAELFPAARFVSLVRDGRAVACSLSRVHWWPDLTVWWYGGTPGRWPGKGRDPWELCARH